MDARRRLSGAWSESAATGAAVQLWPAADDAACVASSLSISWDDDLLGVASPVPVQNSRTSQ